MPGSQGECTWTSSWKVWDKWKCTCGIVSLCRSANEREKWSQTPWAVGAEHCGGGMAGCRIGSPSPVGSIAEDNTQTTWLSAEDQAMTICKRTTLSHLAGLTLPRARISQAFITYSPEGVLFPDYALTSRQIKVCESWGWKQPLHMVLMPFSISRAGIFVGKGMRGPSL